MSTAVNRAQLDIHGFESATEPRSRDTLFERSITMEPRLDLSAVSPGTIKPLLDIEAYLAKSGLEPSLLNLVKCRASPRRMRPMTCTARRAPSFPRRSLPT